MTDAPAAPRPLTEIFADLQLLAQSPGALHQISAIIFRDWLVTVDMKLGEVVDTPGTRWSTSKLNKNELMLLLGLTVQSAADQTYAFQDGIEDFGGHADRLLREFHDRVSTDGGIVMSPDGPDPFAATTIGPVAKEAIYYGADSFYLHQLKTYAPPRYQADDAWLTANCGFDSAQMLKVATFIADRILDQMAHAGHINRHEKPLLPHEMTDSLLISKADLRATFGAIGDGFVVKFATPATSANLGFTDPFKVNEVAVSPLIDIGEFLYVANPYRLLESTYESPFYWMMADKTYAATSAKHRGAFLETTSASILRTVFGASNVYENVTLRTGAKTIAGEIDVLVIYGPFILIGQAKSKRVTLKARAGDSDALANDFKGAVQDPYEQTLSCAALIKSGAACIASDGAAINLPALPMTFPLVILSDPFPAVTFLSGAMLQQRADDAPVIWDLAVLDCVTRVLPSPVDLLFYLRCRAEAFHTMRSDSEYNLLGFHLAHKLVLPEEADLVQIDRDFATAIDDFMIASDVGVARERPATFVDRVRIPVFSELLDELRRSGPVGALVALDLYDLSSDALSYLAGQISTVREEVRGGKPLKAVSIPTRSGGLTYLVVRHRDDDAQRAAKAFGSKHKYDNRKDRWSVVVDCVGTLNPIDALFQIAEPWVEDEDEAENSRRISSVFKRRDV